MFRDSLVESAENRHTDKRATVFLSGVIHTFLVAVLLLTPLIYTNHIEARQLMTFLIAPPPPSNPAPPPPQDITTSSGVRKEVKVDPENIIAPTEIPREIARIADDQPAAIVGALPGLSHEKASDVFRFGVRDEEKLPLPPVAPPPPEPPPSISQPVRVGGNFIQAYELFKPRPPYPPLARQVGVQGVVVLEATINKEGLIGNLRVLSGHPLLNQAALDTVKTWRYKPPTLNSEPVEVITTITVTFSLSRQ